jgi:hypothetical protein
VRVNARLLMVARLTIIDYSGIQNLPVTMLAALEQISKTTGLIGTSIFVGPEPSHGGNLFAMT